MLSLLLLCCTSAPALVEGDAGPPCAGPPAAYAVEVVANGAVLVGDASSGDCAPPVVSNLHLLFRPQTVETSPSAKVVLYGSFDCVTVTTRPFVNVARKTPDVGLESCPFEPLVDVCVAVPLSTS